MKNREQHFEKLYDIMREMQQLSKDEVIDFKSKSDDFLIDSQNLHIYFDRLIGHGSTSNVYKGHVVGVSPLHKIMKSMETQHFANCDVAVKIASNFGQNEAENLFQEINAMKKLGAHKNVISFLGWYMYKERLCLAFELSQSDLLNYMASFRERKEDVPNRIFLSILWQIAQGMCYISSKGLIHRDVADFGLCCTLDQNLTYQASILKRLPMKWLPIEALTKRIFSEKSDIWSFGVLMYEMYSLGKMPYENMEMADVLDYLKAGERLGKPDLANEELYETMMLCWEEEPDKRPNFIEISDIFREMLEKLTEDYSYCI